MRCHSLTMSPQSLGTASHDLEKWVSGVVRNLHARFIRLLAARPLPHRISSLRHRRPNVLIKKPHPSLHSLILGQETGSACMCYKAFARLPKDVVCDSVADETFEIQFINIYALGELCIGDFFV
jgi:hypothetical protein